MNEHVQKFNERMIDLFQPKVEEFSKHAEEHPVTACVTSQLVGLYTDLIEVMKSPR